MTPGKRPPFSQVLSELKEDYLRIFPQKLELLQELTQKHDWAGLTTEYHKLKGSGKTYGFPQISIVCEILEDFASQKRHQKPETFEKALILLEKMYQTYLRQQSYALEQDDFALSLLALKPK